MDHNFNKERITKEHLMLFVIESALFEGGITIVHITLWLLWLSRFKRLKTSSGLKYYVILGDEKMF